MLAKVKRSFAAAVVLMLALPAVRAADYRAGEQYTRLDKPVAAAPAVVEFFPPPTASLYQFADTYRVGAAPWRRRCPPVKSHQISRQPDGQPAMS